MPLEPLLLTPAQLDEVCVAFEAIGELLQVRAHLPQDSTLQLTLGRCKERPLMPREFQVPVPRAAVIAEIDRLLAEQGGRLAVFGICYHSE